MQSAEASWPSRDSIEPAPDWYSEDVFRNALRRVVAVLNASGATARIKLDGTDQQVASTFNKSRLDEALIQYNIASSDAKAATNEHSAEYHFYANVNFTEREGARVAVFGVPRPFLDWGYQNLQSPAPDALLAADFPGGADAPEYVMHCATNYLVKNFWHNFVHHNIQGINNGNYGAFRGMAREDSDFQADHVANILTLCSYGIAPLFRGKGSTDRSDRINAIFTRNRCNRIFAKRARHRTDDMAAASDDARWSELEWRFCRGVANRISTTLLANHLATPSLKVFLGGEVRKAPNRNARWRSGEVLVEVADRRYATNIPAYVPCDEWKAYRTGTAVTGKREGDIRRFRARREREIAEAVRISYGRQVGSDVNFRTSIGLQLEALGIRIGAHIV
ncbi:MAG: hypothetical protein WC804_21485 [Sphingomonas sp.]|uniref:hypothetical protein n=1 Tax=Sphingomonas sp. TaxID=28214 RepID=UPI00356765C4